MLLDDADIVKGVELVRAAAFNPERWTDVLAFMERMVDGARVALHGYDTRVGHLVGAVGQRYDPHFVDLFANGYAAINPWNAGIERLPVGIAHPTEAFAPREEVLATAFHADWVLPQENILTGAGLTVFREEGRALVLAGNLRVMDQEQRQPELLRLMDAFAPHLREAFELRRHVRLMEAGAAVATLEAVEPGAALIVLDGTGRALCTNASADMLVREARLPIDRQGRLRVEGAAQAVLADGLAGRSAARIAPLISRAGVEPLLMRLLPLPRGDGAVIDDLDVRGAKAVAVIRDPSAPIPVSLEAAAKLYDLTPAERSLAEALCRGVSLDEHAALRRVSRNTVRNQLRAVMLKTGATRQAELVARLVRLAEPHHEAPDPIVPPDDRA